MSSTAILVNKHIMVDLRFPYPITVAWLGLLTTTVASATVVHMVLPMEQRTFLPWRQYMQHVLPTGVCMALTFQTGNLSYLFLTVAMVQMLKALCPVITLLLLFGFGLERPSARLLAAVTIISAGVAAACWGEVRMSAVGLVCMLTSVATESLRLVLTQHLLMVGQKLHPFEGLMYIGSACTAVLTLQACVWEVGPMLRHKALALVAQHPVHFAAAAFAGFGVNLLAILVIKLASSLTLKVLGTIKDALLVVVGVAFLHEHVSAVQLSGYSVSVVGFIAYNMIKAAAPGARTAGSLLPLSLRRLSRTKE